MGLCWRPLCSSLPQKTSPVQALKGQLPWLLQGARQGQFIGHRTRTIPDPWPLGVDSPAILQPETLTAAAPQSSLKVARSSDKASQRGKGAASQQASLCEVCVTAVTDSHTEAQHDTTAYPPPCLHRACGNGSPPKPLGAAQSAQLTPLQDLAEMVSASGELCPGGTQRPENFGSGGKAERSWPCFLRLPHMG